MCVYDGIQLYCFSIKPLSFSDHVFHTRQSAILKQQVQCFQNQRVEFFPHPPLWAFLQAEDLKLLEDGWMQIDRFGHRLFTRSLGNGYTHGRTFSSHLKVSKIRSLSHDRFSI